MINLTLNKLKRPALLNLVPKFGTLVEKNDINKGGLSTAEVDLNMTLPFELMREIEVSSSDTTTKIQYDAKIAIVGSDHVTLTLDEATYKGCTITIKNRNTQQATIVLSEDNQKNLESKKSLVLEWDGTTWIDTTLIIDSTISEDSHNPISSAAVYQKANEITQTVTNETNARNEAIAEERRLREEANTAVEQKVTDETTARTEADETLSTRIDEEVTARTEADTNFTKQIEAIEQLHATLIGPGDFVDSDGDTITVNDSNKSIRQIAHEEFYRQLITDAAEVQSQIDTLKELADYLQTNPSVIADMYSKLGITWSVDNLTDFGTFDFSDVLSATNVDEAVLELYNTFTNKIGELTSLTTSAKDNIVSAVNELKTKIDGEVTTRTEADTELGTRIDGEVEARTNADSELDGKITSTNNSIGQLESLKTTEKSNTVAAINEVYDSVQQIGSTGNTATNCEQFTFVVDSNEALAEWASNDRSKSQDYTSVLIRKGEWTSSVGINLTAAGTKVVVGEAGSKLIFDPMDHCLYYDNIPDNSHYMKGLTVKNGRGATSFLKCINLENCIALESYFYESKNIINCTAKEFRQGENYFNCTATSFSGCRNLSKCTAENLSSGKGGYGFRSCYNLIDCNGVGTGTIEGYGFESCTGVFRCKGRGSTGVFKDCYASQSKTTDYACADTPAGGFNDTTNPPA